MSDRLQALYAEHGQSPWLDNLKRGYITSRQLVSIRDGGVRGLTSNPSIFQKAIQGSADYDEQFREVVAAGSSIIEQWPLRGMSTTLAWGSAAAIARSGTAPTCSANIKY